MRKIGLTLLIGLFWIPLAMAATPVRIATHVSELSPLYHQAQLFVSTINQQSSNQFDFEFKFYPSGQLGNEKALLTSVKAGSIEMIIIASGMIKQVKELDLFDLPWLFKDRDHIRRVMQGALGQEIADLISKKTGVTVLGIYENGFRHVMNNQRPIQTIEDLSGLKIRVSGGKMRQQVFYLLGAQPQSIDWKESFTSMETGVVDGSESATYGFYEQKLYEVQSYLSLTHHVYTPSFLLVANSFFSRLTPAQQQMFRTVGHRITDQTYTTAAQMEARYLEAMQGKIKINTPPDLTAFRRQVQPVYEAYAKQHGRQWLQQVEAQR